jgi:hypothetical protein
MENIFNEQNCPESYTELREFDCCPSEGKKQKKVEIPSDSIEDSDSDDFVITKCSFEVSVRFRQHSTWQGEILWAEKKVKQNFRSVLELLVLIDQALSCC